MGKSVHHTPHVLFTSASSLTADEPERRGSGTWRAAKRQNRAKGNERTSVAFALQARDASEVQAVPPSLTMKLRNMLGSFSAALDENEHAGADQTEAAGNALEALTEDIHDGVEFRKRHRDSLLQGASLRRADSLLSLPDTPCSAQDSVHGSAATPFSSRASTYTPCTDGSGGPAMLRRYDNFAHDDPVSCSAYAIGNAIPGQLLAVLRHDPDVARVWTTLCCCSLLQDFPVCWIWGNGAHAVHVSICFYFFVSEDAGAEHAGPPQATSMRRRSGPSWTLDTSGCSATRRSTRR